MVVHSAAEAEALPSATCQSTDDEAKAAIEIVGSISAYMLAKLARRERHT